MFTLFSENWCLYILRGILALCFGLIVLIWPGLTLEILIMLFGIYALLQGVVAFAVVFKYGKENFSWLILLEGIAGIAVGFFAFIWPALTAFILLVFIALWAIITGLLEIVAAIQLSKARTGEWILGLAGVISVFFGAVLLLNPSIIILAMVWMVALYAIIFGLLMMYIGIKFRKYRTM